MNATDKVALFDDVENAFARSGVRGCTRTVSARDRGRRETVEAARHLNTMVIEYAVSCAVDQLPDEEGSGMQEGGLRYPPSGRIAAPYRLAGGSVKFSLADVLQRHAKSPAVE